MFIRPFGYERAETLAHACALLREHGPGAKVLAGGQSLLPMVNLGLAEPEVLVDVSRAGDGRGVAGSDGELAIGALTTHAELARDDLVRTGQPLLAAAAGRVGNPRVRVRGTLGGSLAHADPAAELPLAMTVVGATYELTDGRETRQVRAEEFCRTFFTTALGEDEVLASVRVPTLGPGWGWGFQELSRREGDFAVVAAAALVRIAGGAVVEARVGLGGVADRPIRLGAVEAALGGAEPAGIGERVGPIEGLEPLTDTAASAAYRTHLARVLVIRALRDACRRAGEAA